MGQRAEVLPSILDLLNLEYVEENLYRSCAVYRDEYRLFGGQVAAQALYAAGRTVPDGRLPHSLPGYFLRQGATVKPTLFRVERDRDGRSFSARRVVAVQDGEVGPEPGPRGLVPPPGADGRLDLAGPDPADRGRRPRSLHRGDLQPRRSARREHRARGPLQEEARKGSIVTGTLAGKTILMSGGSRGIGLAITPLLASLRRAFARASDSLGSASAARAMSGASFQRSG